MGIREEFEKWLGVLLFSVLGKHEDYLIKNRTDVYK
jgi:hypothetical protein